MAKMTMTDQTNSTDIPPPAGTTWMGEWDTEFGDRIYGADPIVVGAVAALLTGVQHRSGSTVSGVALRMRGAVIAGDQGAVVIDLTPAQAREIADALNALADRAEALDGLA